MKTGDQLILKTELYKKRTRFKPDFEDFEIYFFNFVGKISTNCFYKVTIGKISQTNTDKKGRPIYKAQIIDWEKI